MEAHPDAVARLRVAGGAKLAVVSTSAVVAIHAINAAAIEVPSYGNRAMVAGCADSSFCAGLASFPNTGPAGAMGCDGECDEPRPLSLSDRPLLADAEPEDGCVS